MMCDSSKSAWVHFFGRYWSGTQPLLVRDLHRKVFFISPAIVFALSVPVLADPYQPQKACSDARTKPNVNYLNLSYSEYSKSGVSTNEKASLSTVEIVAKVKPCVVTIKVWNSNNPRVVGLGTGFFIDKDRIMTDAHVIGGDVDSIFVCDLDGHQINVDPVPTYINDWKAFDIGILAVTNGSPHSYLSFRELGDLPAEGEAVTVIGNPLGLTGTVSTGIVSAVRDDGNIIQFTAPISNGSSGGPVVDDQGRVVGIVNSSWSPGGRGRIVENLNFAHGVLAMLIAASNQYKWESDDLVIPRNFSAKSRYFDGYQLKQVLDEAAIVAISGPVYGYLVDSAKGSWTDASKVMTELIQPYAWNLNRWFDLNPEDLCLWNVSTNVFSYSKKWPVRYNHVSNENVVVEKLVGTEKVGPRFAACYLVTMPYDWSISNGKTHKTGQAVALAFVVPQYRDGKRNYLISSLWNEGKQSGYK
jgi:hypothetical protein